MAVKNFKHVLLRSDKGGTFADERQHPELHVTKISRMIDRSIVCWQTRKESRRKIAGSENDEL
jgi:hypothetical protein